MLRSIRPRLRAKVTFHQPAETLSDSSIEQLNRTLELLKILEPDEVYFIPRQIYISTMTLQTELNFDGSPKE